MSKGKRLLRAQNSALAPKIYCFVGNVFCGARALLPAAKVDGALALRKLFKAYCLPCSCLQSARKTAPCRRSLSVGCLVLRRSVTINFFAYKFSAPLIPNSMNMRFIQVFFRDVAHALRRNKAVLLLFAALTICGAVLGTVFFRLWEGGWHCNRLQFALLIACGNFFTFFLLLRQGSLP